MVNKPLTSLADYLRNIQTQPLPPSDIPEERAPDLPTAISSSAAEEVTSVRVPTSPNVNALFRFFVDGVQRTVPIGEVIVNNVRVPLHLSHLIVGAMERVGNKLRPFILREALVLLLPYQALRLAGNPPGRELDSAGKIYQTIQSGDLLYSDTSLTLRLSPDGRPSVLLQAGDLIRTGEVRQKALSRAKELLRILELGLLWELRQKQPNDWILLDGPVAPTLKYGRLAAPDLRGLEEIARPDIAFDFLCRIVGAVKRVQIVPTDGLEKALNYDPNNPNDLFLIPLYRFGEVIEEDDAVAKEILSAFLWLRRELTREVSSLWSTVSGLARFDIPLPAVFDNEQWKHSWNLLNEQTLVNSLTQTDSPEHRRLEELLQAVVLERWPVPSVTLTRTLTELFPIAETERWLTSQLLSVYEIRSIL